MNLNQILQVNQALQSLQFLLTKLSAEKERFQLYL